ncbi:MAG TPA: hypothetical protein VF789_05335 [Thermoanaerobaculia bacterium]
MNRKTSRAVAAGAALLLAAGAAWAACEACKYKDRGDRREGVEDWQVSGASFDLLAVQYRQGEPWKTASDRLFVYFWLPAGLTPTIEVREPGKNYMMHPAKKPYPQGLQSFSWPRGEVVAPLGIDPAGLQARVSNREETVYYPAFLSSGPRPAPGGTYAFVYESGAGIDVDCTVSRDQGGQLVPVRKWIFTRDLGGRLAVEWNGRDDQGRPAPPGRYVLRLKGDMLTETVRPLNATLTFEHYGQLQ